MVIEGKKSRQEAVAQSLQADRSDKRLRGFIHVLAHEVKSPLATVTACLSLLQERYGAQFDEETQGFVRDSHAAIRNISDLLNTLSDFARLGSRPQEFTEVDLEAAFYKVYANLRGVIKDSGAVVTHDPLPAVWGDELQLRQLLQNLIANAIKYRSATAPMVHLGIEETERCWTFSVRDNGIGVPAEHRERIFAAFVRLAIAEQLPGTGIGLALCKVIAENHGGRIWLEPQPCEGSVFRFTIAKWQPASARAGAPLEEVTLAAATVAGA